LQEHREAAIEEVYVGPSRRISLSRKPICDAVVKYTTRKGLVVVAVVVGMYDT
jgi:hypothetical protein